MIARTKINLLLLVLLLLILPCFSQTPATDSLKTLLRSAKSDSARCRLLSALIEIEYDDKIWPKYNDELFDLSFNRFTEAKYTADKEVYAMYYSNAVNNRGYLAQEHGNLSKALEYYFLSLKLSEEIGDTGQTATTISNIGYIYMTQGDLDKAMAFVHKALDIQKKARNKRGIAYSLNNLGSLYKRKNENEKALDYFKQSLVLNEQINNKDGISVCLANMSDIYLEKKEYDKAIEYLNRSLQLKEEIQDPDGMTTVLSSIANAYIYMNRLEEALKYAERSYKMAKELNYVENLRNAASVLYRIYKKQNKNEQALKMFEIYIQMRDSIKDESNRKSTIRKELQYNYDKKAAADSVKVSEERKVIAAQLKQEETQRFALIGGLILVALFGIFMFNRFKVSQRQNSLINNQKTELQKQKELIEEAQKETLDSIHYAKRIQNALISNSKFISEHLPGNFIYFEPKDIVSGDFYWSTSRGDKFYLAVCDSTGHGVPGAFMSLLNMGFINEAINEKNIEKPNEIFNYVRERLITTISSDGQKDGMDGILICMDKKKNTFEYCAANNEPILIRDGKLIELDKDKMPVGKGERSDNFTAHSLDLKKGDLLYLYTDGYADQFGGAKGKKFKYKQLNELLLSIKDLPLNEQKQKLQLSFMDWKGDLEQVDDVLIAGIKI